MTGQMEPCASLDCFRLWISEPIWNSVAALETLPKSGGLGIIPIRCENEWRGQICLRYNLALWNRVMRLATALRERLSSLSLLLTRRLLVQPRDGRELMRCDSVVLHGLLRDIMLAFAVKVQKKHAVNNKKCMK